MEKNLLSVLMERKRKKKNESKGFIYKVEKAAICMEITTVKKNEKQVNGPKIKWQ